MKQRRRREKRGKGVEGVWDGSVEEEEEGAWAGSDLKHQTGKRPVTSLLTCNYPCASPS